MSSYLYTLFYPEHAYNHGYIRDENSVYVDDNAVWDDISKNANHRNSADDDAQYHNDKSNSKEQRSIEPNARQDIRNN